LRLPELREKEHVTNITIHTYKKVVRKEEKTPVGKKNFAHIYTQNQDRERNPWMRRFFHDLSE